MTSTAMTVRFSRALALDTGSEGLSPGLITIIVAGLGVATVSSLPMSPHTGLSDPNRRSPGALDIASYGDDHIEDAIVFRRRPAAQTSVAAPTSSDRYRGSQRGKSDKTRSDTRAGRPGSRIEPAPGRHRTDRGEPHGPIRTLGRSARHEQASYRVNRFPVVETHLSSSGDLPTITARTADFDLMGRLARPRTILAETGDAIGSRPALATATVARPQEGDVAVEQQTAQDPFSGDRIDRRPVDADAAEMAAIGKPYQAGGGVGFDVTTRVNGADVGKLTLFVAGADLEHPEALRTNISVNLGDIVTLLRTKMSQELYDDLTSSTAAQQYVTLNDLRAHGISVSFDHHDRLSLKLA